MSEERTYRMMARLPSWWKKTRYSTTYQLFKAFSESFDENDVQVQNLHDEIFVNTATGERLDDLARIFKMTRQEGETDASFRARIKAYWPGFSGGGTIPAIISTISKMTGVPETDITLTEATPPAMKFRVGVLLDDPGEDLLIPTIKNVVESIKAAGVYPFYTWILNGALLGEDLTISDSVIVDYISSKPWFIYEVSLIDGAKLLW